MTEVRSATAKIKAYRSAARIDQREDLILEHLDYVRHVLGRIVCRLPDGVDVENLEAAGVLGLVQAASQFDPTRGVAFKTFAFPRIRGAVVDEMRRNCPVPQQMLQKISRLKRAMEKLASPATPEGLVEQTGFSEQEVESCLEAMRLTRLDKQDDAASTIENLSDSRTAAPASAIEQAEAQRLLADCIEELPEQERLVITLYYLEDLRLREIGVVLSLSESRVSRILSKAEFRLKEMVQARSGPA